MPSWLPLVLLVQGAYYAVTGLWPLLSIRTFQMVTGPKTDLWLVRTVGILILVIGIVLLLGTFKPNTAIMTLALGSAAGLAAIDIVYVSCRVIAHIYLMDAVLQVIFILLISIGLSLSHT